MKINTKDWSAWINLIPGSPHMLIVTGLVETSASNMLPVLRAAVPQGFNPQILMLNLSIEDNGGIGTPAFGYRDARFDRPAEKDDYTSVTILYEGEIIADIQVTEAH